MLIFYVIIMICKCFISKIETWNENCTVFQVKNPDSLLFFKFFYGSKTFNRRDEGNQVADFNNIKILTNTIK